MMTKEGCWWLMVLLAFAVTACGEKPTGPETADLDPVAAFAKPPGTPGGGGKPAPEADIPLKVTIHEDAGEGILSDGQGDYLDGGEDHVSAVIKTDGRLYFQTFDGKKKDPVLRGVTVDLSSPGPVFSQGDLNDFMVDVGADWPVFTSEVTLHTRDSSGGMYTMGVGTTLLDAGKIGFNDYGDASWEWRLLFGARIETPEGGVDHYEDGLCVTHGDDNTWVVRNYGVGCAFEGVTQLWRVVGGDFIYVADFTTPMHLTLSTPPGS